MNKSDTPETDLEYPQLFDAGNEYRLVEFCRRLERERDNAIDGMHCATDLMERAIAERDEARQIAEYWHGVSECECGSALPIGGCLHCDMKKILTRRSGRASEPEVTSRPDPVSLEKMQRERDEARQTAAHWRDIACEEFAWAGPLPWEVSGIGR